MGSDISGSIYTCDFPRVPPYGSSVRLKKPIRDGGVSIYVTTRRNPLVCTGRTADAFAGKSPPTDTQGDHGVIMGWSRGDHGVLSPVSFPTFGLLLYYNTQAALETTTRAPTRTRDHHACTHAHRRTHASTWRAHGVHMVGGAPGGRSVGRTG